MTRTITTDAPSVRERMLAEQGVTVIRTSTSARGLDLPAVLRDEATMRIHWGETVLPIRLKAPYRP